MKRQQVVRNPDTGELEVRYVDLGPSRIPRRPRPSPPRRRHRDPEVPEVGRDRDKPRYLARTGRISSKADGYQARGYTEQHWLSIDRDDDKTNGRGRGEQRQLLAPRPRGKALDVVDDEWLEKFARDAHIAATHTHAAADLGLRNPYGEARHADRWIVSLTPNPLLTESGKRERELRQFEILIRQRPATTCHSPHRDVRRVGGIPRKDDCDEADLDSTEFIADDVSIPTGAVRGPKPTGSRLDTTAKRYLVRTTGLTRDEMIASLKRGKQANRTHRRWVAMSMPAVRTKSTPDAIGQVLEISRQTVWRLHSEGRQLLATLDIAPTIEAVEGHIAYERNTTCSTITR